MRMMSMITMTVALAAAPAMAQEAHPDGRADMMQVMHGQGGMMGRDAGPGMILKLKESLELTDDQVKRLMTIQKEAQAGMQQHMMAGMKAMQAADKLLDVASPDFAAYEVAMRGAANHMVLAHTGMARADVEARQVLTADQRNHLTLARKMMKEMKEGAEKAAMMKEGMMKDGMKKDGGQ